jgi:uncharacterized protein (TIGR00255 family)
LRRFYERELLSTAEALVFEQPFVLELDPGNGEAVVRFRGVIDRIDRHPDGSLEVIDYKTGKTKTQRDVDEDELWSRIEPELGLCFEAYEAARIKEGEATRADIESQLARITAAVDIVKSHVPEIEQTVRSQLLARFKEVMGDVVDEGRVLTETATLLMKYTVNEELSRLNAHVLAFRRSMDSDPAPGKKLDFLCQEMNREVNTIGSKNILLPVSQAVVELKDALENVREQLRNAE